MSEGCIFFILIRKYNLPSLSHKTESAMIFAELKTTTKKKTLVPKAICETLGPRKPQVKLCNDL